MKPGKRKIRNVRYIIRFDGEISDQILETYERESLKRAAVETCTVLFEVLYPMKMIHIHSEEKNVEAFYN